MEKQKNNMEKQKNIKITILPRQSGKTTLAEHLFSLDENNSILVSHTSKISHNNVLRFNLNSYRGLNPNNIILDEYFFLPAKQIRKIYEDFKPLKCDIYIYSSLPSNYDYNLIEKIRAYKVMGYTEDEIYKHNDFAIYSDDIVENLTWNYITHPNAIFIYEGIESINYKTYLEAYDATDSYLFYFNKLKEFINKKSDEIDNRGKHHKVPLDLNDFSYMAKLFIRFYNSRWPGYNLDMLLDTIQKTKIKDEEGFTPKDF